MSARETRRYSSLKYNFSKVNESLEEDVNINLLRTTTAKTTTVIENNIIIKIRTFPECISPENFPMPNNFVDFECRRMPHHMEFIPVVTNLSYQCKCIDVISHVSVAKNRFLFTVRTYPYQIESHQCGQKAIGMAHFEMATNTPAIKH